MFISLRTSPLVSLYQQKRERVYVPFSRLIEGLIVNILDGGKIDAHQVISRVKTVSSFAEKVRRKKYKYKFLSEVTDIVGVRVITYLARDVDRAHSLLRENFLIDSKNSIDKRVPTTVSQFGYQSLHVIAQLTPARATLPEYSRFEKLKFEIQIRSILQHSWAEIEHDINYKSVIELTPNIKRKLHRAAALLEQADEIFSEIGHDLIEKNQVDTTIGKCGADDKITPKLFAILLEKDEFVIQLQELLDSLSGAGVSHEMDPPSILGMRIKDMNSVGIHTVRDLRLAIKENIRYLPDFAALRLRGGEESADDSAFYRSASVVNLCEFIIGKTADYEKVLKYLVKDNANVDPYEREIAREIVEAVTEILASSSPRAAAQYKP
jgi:putative GTP pyrophosphokinase